MEWNPTGRIVVPIAISKLSQTQHWGLELVRSLLCSSSRSSNLTSTMEFSQEDFDRLLLFEHTRKTAEANYVNNPLDADVSLSSFLSIRFMFSYSVFIWFYSPRNLTSFFASFRRVYLFFRCLVYELNFRFEEWDGYHWEIDVIIEFRLLKIVYCRRIVMFMYFFSEFDQVGRGAAWVISISECFWFKRYDQRYFRCRSKWLRICFGCNMPLMKPNWIWLCRRCFEAGGGFGY